MWIRIASFILLFLLRIQFPKNKSIVPDPSKLGSQSKRTPATQYAMDITGEFDGRWIVILLDSYSGIPEIMVMKDTTSGRIIRWLEDVFAWDGNPEGILTDNGPQFVSREFESFLASKDIHHYTSSVYNLQENGQVEVFNHYIKHGIQAFQSTNTNWDKGLRSLMQSYRATPLEGGKSPAELFLGRKIRMDHQPNPAEPSRRTVVETRRQDEDDKRPESEHTLKKGIYKRGDRVLTKLPHVAKGRSPYSEPKTVQKILGYFTFLLSNGYVWHVRKLKPYRTEDNEEETVVEEQEAENLAPAQQPRRKPRTANKWGLWPGQSPWRSSRTRRSPKRLGWDP